MIPALPIPPLLRGADPGSFAEDTIVRRLPELALRVLSENSFDEATNRRLHTLVSDLPHGLVRPLLDTNAPDWSDWQKALYPFFGQTWLEVPLFAAETYFYRRILEATGYFQPGPGYGVDPYRLQKELGLAQAGMSLEQALPVGRQRWHRLIHMSLWGNQADLSLWPVQAGIGGRARGGGRETHLLADESAAALAYIDRLDKGRVEFILDNSGTELIIDLLLADALLEHNPCLSIRFHVKPHPIFVSDVLAADITQSLRWLETDAPAWAQQVAKRLVQAEKTGRMQVVSRFYWASPTPAWDAPPDLWADLAGSVLLISKGDVNYRRWLGDARWHFSTPLKEIFNCPAPLLLLRVMKSPVAGGLDQQLVDKMLLRDPAWQVNGQWGLIQFVKP